MTHELSASNKIYSGTAGSCCCGCSGKYWDAGEPSFKSMQKKIIRLIDTGEYEIEQDANYLCVTVNNRWYILYFD